MMDSTIQWNNRAHVRITYEKWYLPPIDICPLLNKNIAMNNLNKGRGVNQ